MKETPWLLFDTETTCLAAPIFVVELSAPQMHGWEPEGDAFRKLLNQNQEIPAEARRVQGYAPEILERDGEAPLQVYREFSKTPAAFEMMESACFWLTGQGNSFPSA